MFLPKVNAWLLGNNNSNVRKGRVEGGDVVKQQRFHSQSESNTHAQREREREEKETLFSLSLLQLLLLLLGFLSVFLRIQTTKTRETIMNGVD